MSGEPRQCYDAFVPLPLLGLAKSTRDRSKIAP